MRIITQPPLSWWQVQLRGFTVLEPTCLVSAIYVHVSETHRHTPTHGLALLALSPTHGHAWKGPPRSPQPDCSLSDQTNHVVNRLLTRFPARLLLGSCHMPSTGTSWTQTSSPPFSAPCGAPCSPTICRRAGPRWCLRLRTPACAPSGAGALARFWPSSRSG